MKKEGGLVFPHNEDHFLSVLLVSQRIAIIDHLDLYGSICSLDFVHVNFPAMPI